MSDKDYIPNSESEDDDSDASITFMPSQSKAAQFQVKPVIPDVGTSYGSDTSIPAGPSTSKELPPLEDHIVPDTAETSNSPNSSAKVSSKDKPEEQDLTNLTMCKKNYCFVCGKPQSKISRHLKTHKTHAEIVHAFSLPENSKQCKMLLEKMRNKGNFTHNTSVLQGGS